MMRKPSEGRSAQEKWQIMQEGFKNGKVSGCAEALLVEHVRRGNDVSGFLQAADRLMHN